MSDRKDVEELPERHSDFQATRQEAYGIEVREIFYTDCHYQCDALIEKCDMQMTLLMKNSIEETRIPRNGPVGTDATITQTAHEQ